MEPLVAANLGLRTSSQRTLMQQRHRLEKRLSSGPVRRRSTLMMTIVACKSESSASDEASVETDTIEPEGPIYDRQVLAQFGDNYNEHHPPSRACYSDFVRHNTMKRNGHPPLDLPVPSNLRRTTPRRRSVLVPALHCKIQADQPSQTLRRHPRLQDIPSEALS
ncbi:hypothetical protein BGZ67_007371 [Mortierella alpina]|nr:hypothetical protein BGZ67_007371 [Mortierella alpina]